MLEQALIVVQNFQKEWEQTMKDKNLIIAESQFQITHFLGSLVIKVRSQKSQRIQQRKTDLFGRMKQLKLKCFTSSTGMMQLESVKEEQKLYPMILIYLYLQFHLGSLKINNISKISSWLKKINFFIHQWRTTLKNLKNYIKKQNFIGKIHSFLIYISFFMIFGGKIKIYQQYKKMKSFQILIKKNVSSMTTLSLFMTGKIFLQKKVLGQEEVKDILMTNFQKISAIL
ncbi:transmembrane protein, putative (macronuclear) [Tetrahymena thermophila SB210]|uniref:Transmembrane protein, putative n=1 Tax=Tetrahymena thermophila (strain SB210) TaxID=312017 RepID=W7X415_TETTS|nr:transmembrane protein, putative [Tetrahymena thermophila SB210]EWS74055.1 transmembrane protein, putative [Tetrahymena thermophila SB210]|eukprot:XP_012653388.1 transmembrane protein, putative [Tetrahymena thermophila SB210]